MSDPRDRLPQTPPRLPDDMEHLPVPTALPKFPTFGPTVFQQNSQNSAPQVPDDWPAWLPTPLQQQRLMEGAFESCAFKTTVAVVAGGRASCVVCVCVCVV